MQHKPSLAVGVVALLFFAFDLSFFNNLADLGLFWKAGIALLALGFLTTARLYDALPADVRRAG